jgi:hypothetical protein
MPWRVRDVVRAVVAEVAPEELPVVDGLAAFDDARVVRRLMREGERREPLGFGLGELAALAAPVMWLVLDETGRRLAGAAADEAAKGAKGLLRKVFRRRSEAVTIPPLTREQLGEVHQRVLEVAVRRGLPEKRAMVIADAVVARLALPAPDGTAAASDDPATGQDGRAGEATPGPGRAP